MLSYRQLALGFHHALFGKRAFCLCHRAEVIVDQALDGQAWLVSVSVGHAVRRALDDR